jgi:hypothetical protein
MFITHVKEMRSSYRILVENLEWESPFGITGSTYDNTKMVLKEESYKRVNWFHPGQEYG